MRLDKKEEDLQTLLNQCSEWINVRSVGYLRKTLAKAMLPALLSSWRDLRSFFVQLKYEKNEIN
ncbi:LOW QUALITY PROTEIN: Hypothetical protein PHPALM_193 [Phytophthora palmivora]|uniref:Uncharacterized protein n=1 Tax=Phytophthora palmivora TaxID=4796 RepID=A0A2P4YVG0_9STRA|nr:LOW QUALITY PROTEIN: Hypothetical protein PHPALM_193 [Phytophthora palmivora]